MWLLYARNQKAATVASRGSGEENLPAAIAWEISLAISFAVSASVSGSETAFCSSRCGAGALGLDRVVVEGGGSAGDVVGAVLVESGGGAGDVVGAAGPGEP